MERREHEEECWMNEWDEDEGSCERFFLAVRARRGLLRDHLRWHLNQFGLNERDGRWESRKRRKLEKVGESHPRRFHRRC